MLSGLPASGKSTYAELLVLGGGNWVRVNRDLLRTMFHFDKWSGKNEDITVSAEKQIIMGCLYNGNNVVVDDTNLSPSHYAMWKGLAVEMGSKFEHKHFDTNVWECIKRDGNRQKKVGRAVLLNMAMQYNLVPNLKNIVVCDIDGTVADCEHRKSYLEKEPKDWKGFFSKMSIDTPRIEVYNEAMETALANDAELIFVSARPEDYREVTEAWLKFYGMDYLHLIMRKSGDKRPDVDVKQQILDKYLSHYNIVKVFDDRPIVLEEVWIKNLGKDKVVDCGNGIDF